MNMRAKLKLVAIEKTETSETLHFRAVSKKEGYPNDGRDENNSYALWTPQADLKMVITNPALSGKFSPGEEFYIDFTQAH